MKDNMGYSSYHHWGCLFINCLIFVMTCLWTFLGKLNIEAWLLVAWCVIPYWLKSLHLPSVASLLLCVTGWAGRWLYSSPLEALVVLVITGTDRSVISYKYKLFDHITSRTNFAADLLPDVWGICCDCPSLRSVHSSVKEYAAPDPSHWLHSVGVRVAS